MVLSLWASVGHAGGTWKTSERRPRAEFERPVHQALQYEAAAVGLQLEHVLPGEGIRGGKKQQDEEQQSEIETPVEEMPADHGEQ